MSILVSKKPFFSSEPTTPLTADSDDMMNDSKYKVEKSVRFNKGNGGVDKRQKIKANEFNAGGTYNKTYERTPMPAKGWAIV